MTPALAQPDVGEAGAAALLALAQASDTVELKVTVPEAGHRSAVDALGLDPLDAEIRQVFFFDTPDLRLDDRGVVLRARRMQRKGGDSIVKLRPVDPATLSPELRRLEGFGVEVDAMPGGFVCSARLRRMLDAERVRDVARGRRPPAKAFTKEQRAFLAEHAGDVGLDDVRVLGPIFVLKLRFSPPELQRKMVAEVWLYPDDSRILELSTKCATSEPFQVAVECRAYLEERGVDLGAEQATKTRRALEVLSSALRH